MLQSVLDGSQQLNSTPNYKNKISPYHSSTSEGFLKMLFQLFVDLYPVFPPGPQGSVHNIPSLSHSNHPVG